MPSTTTAAAPQARELADRWKLHRAGREWRGSCPACGYGADAFCLTESKGRALAWCASCQDRTALAALLRGEGAGGGRAADPAAPERARAEQAAKQRERAAALWNGAEAVPGTPGAVYLASRGLPDLAASPALRWRADCPHPTERGRLPALLAAITAPDGTMAGLHRTFLRRDGSGKANVVPQKASVGPTWRGAIRLHAAGGVLTVGEGIESAAAAGLLAGLPAWAGISAGNMARALVLPPEVRSVVIAVDNDPPGRRAAADAAARWRGEGRAVRFLVPRAAGADAADLVREAAQ